MEMVAYIQAILCAILFGAKAAYSKKIMQSDVSEILIIWASFFFAIPVLFIFFFLKTDCEIPSLNYNFYESISITLSLNILAVYLFTKAIKISPLSLTVPFVSFTPLYMILTSLMILGEKVSITGSIGIILIVIGSYVLNIGDIHQGIFKPFKSIFKEKGSLLAFIVAFIWSITANYDKRAVLNSSPLFYLLSFNITFSTIFLIIIYGNRQKTFVLIKKYWYHLIILGLLGGLMATNQMLAIETIHASYVIAIKRAGMIVSTFLGFIYFKERRIIERILGAILMLLGVMFIASVFGRI